MAEAYGCSVNAKSALVAVKTLHTVVWAFFVVCIIALPVSAVMGHLHLAMVLAAVTAFEVIVLAINGWRCPLTDVAARFTGERRANFDIFLPLWLAKYNKAIFGPLYAVGCLIALAQGVFR